MINRILLLLSLLLIWTTELFAQAPSGELPLSIKLIQMAPMFVVVFAIFYFLVIKPQNQKMKEQQKLLSELKAGDKVVTNFGLHGKVALIEEQVVNLEIAPNVKIKLDKESINKKV